MNDFYRGYMQGFKDASLPKQSDSEQLGEPDDLMIAYMSGLHDGKKLAQSRSDIKPLSEAAIEGLAKFVAIDDFNYDFARAIEKAHGITKENK